MNSSSQKISRETLYKSLEQLLLDAHQHRRRKFVETVELQVVLRNYDTNRERRFSNSIRLPHIIRPRYRICVYGDEAHCDEARANHIACMSVEDLKRLNKNRKKIRQLEHRYDVFLASESLIRLIPRLLGPGLGRVGKFPTLLTHQETLAEKIEQIKSTLRVRMKKQPLINVPIGHVQMTLDQLLVHLNMSINFIIGLLRKHWQHVGKIFLKSKWANHFVFIERLESEMFSSVQDNQRKRIGVEEKKASA